MGKSISSREAIRTIEEGGWYLVVTESSHHQFRHPTKAGRVTVPHPVKDLKIGTIKSIERQSGIKLR
jgi:predicted RNA binding protein YcfA (HicA-like mRNA interferase family)